MANREEFLDGCGPECDPFQFRDEKTLTFSLIKEKDDYVMKILSSVYDVLSERGYSPVNQIVGYLISGDPTYITSSKGARREVLKISREEVLEAMVRRVLR